MGASLFSNAITDGWSFHGMFSSLSDMSTRRITKDTHEPEKLTLLPIQTEVVVGSLIIPFIR